MIVNSPLLLLHITLLISCEYFLLEQDDIFCLINLFVGQCMYVLGKGYTLITSGNQRVKLPVYFSPLWGLHRQCHLRLQSTITKLEIHLLCNKKKLWDQLFSTVNIWKSYIWTVNKDVNMKAIFVVLNAS